MSNKERFVFVVGLISAIFFWQWLLGWKLGIILLLSISIHEYGHYRQMGREGITKKVMFFLPIGAIAIAREPWPDLAAEARIALAGPLFGLITTIAFASLWWWSGNPLFAASVFMSATINIFNLLPLAPIMDGGRVVKSVIFSIGLSWGKVFYFLSFGWLITILLLLSWFHVAPYYLILSFFALYFSLKEYSTWKAALAELNLLEQRLEEKTALDRQASESEQPEDDDQLDPQKIKERIKTLKSLANVSAMTKKEMGKYLLVFTLITAIHWYFLILVLHQARADALLKVFAPNH